MSKNGQMTINPKLHLRHLVYIMLAFLLCSCMTADKSSDKQSRKQVYIDANLMFEVSYPEEWVRIQRPINQTPLAKQTITWRINNQQSKQFLLELSIISIPVERNPYGYSGLETIINEQNSELIIQSSEETILPVGPARKVSGQTPRATYKLWLYLGEQNHYIIYCSTATAVFEQHQKQFQQIVDSFKPLN